MLIYMQIRTLCDRDSRVLTSMNEDQPRRYKKWRPQLW